MHAASTGTAGCSARLLYAKKIPGQVAGTAKASQPIDWFQAYTWKLNTGIITTQGTYASVYTCTQCIM